MAVTTLVVAGVLSVQSASLTQSLAMRSIAHSAEKAAQAIAQTVVKPIRFKAAAKVEEAAATTLAQAGEQGRFVVVLGGDGTPLAGGSATTGEPVPEALTLWFRPSNKTKRRKKPRGPITRAI